VIHEYPLLHTVRYGLGVASRADWLDEGLEVLAANGLPGLRIEALTRRLSVTKGSFYHHFVDLADYRRALLGHYEETCTRQHLEANAALGDLPVLDRLHRLSETALELETMHSGLEFAVRAWAAQDDDVRQTVGRVDAMRLGYLEDLVVEAICDADRAHDLALIIYYLLIGSQHAEPPGTVAELRRLWDGLLGQIESSRSDAGGTRAGGGPAPP
jgi:AcrR family transcriptional regulator